MENKIRQFLEEIKNDFGWFLYSYDFEEIEEYETRKINYPACCLLASQLISSFIYVHFSKDVKCIYDIIRYPSGGTGYSHAWSVIEDEIVDYTHFQFRKCPDSLKGNTKISRSDFDIIMEQVKIFYAEDEHIYAGNEDSEIDNYLDQELLAIEYAKKFKPNKDGFMEYLSHAICISEDIVYS